MVHSTNNSICVTKMMSVVNNSLLPTSNIITDPKSSKSTIFRSTPSLLLTSKKGADSLLPALVASPTSTSYPHEDTNYLKSNDFAEQGIAFTDIGDGNTVARMSLENKTSAKLMLPSGLITSFKPEMWHGGTMELLHTSVSKGNDNGSAVIRGGLSLALSFESDDKAISWSPSNSWTLHRVTGDPQESIRVELINDEKGKGVELKHVITLREDILTSEIIVSNTSDTKSIHVKGSVLCHFTVSTPDASYALGLEGTDFLVTKPLVENFSIVPPDFIKTSDGYSGNFSALDKLLFQNARGDDEIPASEVEEELEVAAVEEEEDGYKHLTEKMSRIYIDAPRSFTIMDRGRRNSVIVRRERNGFNEVYMLSPGSEHEMYGEHSYICVGHTAMLEPILVDARSEWRGGMFLLNPNS